MAPDDPRTDVKERGSPSAAGDRAELALLFGLLGLDAMLLLRDALALVQAMKPPGNVKLTGGIVP
jgi:hypothetical protein